MKKSLITHSALAAAAACALTLTGCAGTSGASSAQGDSCDSSSLTTVRVSEVIHSVFYAPQYVADGLGYFCDEGIKIDNTTAQGSDKGTAALLSNSADVALVGPETTVFIKNNPESSTFVKVFAQVTRTDGSFLVGHSADPNFQWDDLKGKTIIGWREGSQPEMVLEYILAQHGLVPGKDVTIITNLAAPAMAGAFLAGQADYVTLYQPTVSTVTAHGGAMLRPLGEDVGELPQTVYTATDTYIKDNPKVLQKFTNAIARAQKWLQTASAQDIAKTLQPYFDTTSMDDLVASAKAYQAINAWPTSPLMTQEGFDKLQQIMVAGGVLKPAQFVQYSDVVDPTFAQHVSEGK